MSAYNVLINTKDLSEEFKCDIIVEKCLPVLEEQACLKMMFIRCIFHIENCLVIFFIYH